MHKKIFKISTVAFLGLMTFGYAQTTTPYEGKVGINNETPKATLEITAYQNTGKTKEGLLIPRLTKSVAQAMITQFPNSGNNKIEESTLIYVTDNVEAGDNAQFVGTGKGFYYFDAAAYKWTKLGTGGSTQVQPRATTLDAITGAIKTVTAITAASWKVGQENIFAQIQTSTEVIELPEPRDYTNRIIAVNNQAGTTLNYKGGTSTPLNSSTCW